MSDSEAEVEVATEAAADANPSDNDSQSDAEQEYERDIEEDDDDDDEDDDDGVVEVTEAVVDEDDDNEGDSEEEAVPVAAASEVAPMPAEGEDEDPDVEAEVVPVETGDHDDDEDEEDDPPILPRTPKAKAKKSGKAKAASTGKGKQKGKKEANSTTKPKEKGKKARRHTTGGDYLDGAITGDRLIAADAARENLLQTVPRLPVPMNESYTVRNFGQLRIDHSGLNVFATPNALYPVGFCCDRYDFSPVHGRVIKMRCAILDGKRTNLDYNGPVFRVMWGQGVDEDVDKVEYPYNPYANSAPITNGEDDVIAVPATQGSAGADNVRQGVPSKGMRVKVRFDKDQFYYGTVDKVESAPTKSGAEGGDKKKKRKKNAKIFIRYDDGSTENATFPDPDINLVMPGNDDETDADGNVQLAFLNGKPVATTIGRTPLEAWSNCLIKLGLVDEIILDSAMEAVRVSREEEAWDGVSLKIPKGDGRKKIKARSMSEDGTVDDKDDGESKADVATSGGETAGAEGDEQEPITEEEQGLRDRVAALRADMVTAREADEKAAVELADARIKLLGLLLCNPFGASETAKSQQASWMAAAVRKEKTKMGSTGNRRKVVTATDLLERNNTFFTPEVESLLEGLPGSEYCTLYQYQANRGSLSANKQWLAEQKLMQEREAKKRMKMSKEAEAKATQQKEKELKRKRREDERDARKRQKLEEEEEKRKARIEERLVRLRVQIEDRLFKEAAFQREKVVFLMAKNLNKEFNRRRKAAELVAGSLQYAEIHDKKTPATEVQDLPPLAKQYDEDIVRIWDFTSTFGTFFLNREYMAKLPTLDELQTAIDTLRGNSTSMNRAEATAFVTDLAVSLCKPLSAGLTRMLFASLIALNPALQKDFGAAFFNEVNATKTKEEEEKSSQTDALLPVDSFTWKEIARIAFESDALGELGYSRQDTAHLLRGYRSAGHPNSKEARRLRRMEDFSIALLRQTLSENHLVGSAASMATNCFRLAVPGANACDKDDWSFYLYNINSMPSPLDPQLVSSNLNQAVDAAKAEGSGVTQEVMKRLEKLSMEINNDGSNVDSIRESVVGLLEQTTGEIFSREGYGKNVSKEAKDFIDKADLTALEKLLNSKIYRSCMGELKNLDLTPKEMKELTRIREEYMSEALRLKEEMKRQEMKEGDEDDDEDEEEEEEEEEQEKTEVEKDESSANAVVVNNKGITDEKETSPVVPIEEKTENAGEEDAKRSDVKSENEEQKIGKETPHDDFCSDIPRAPELIRRCVAVLRTLCQTGPAEPFIYPVDPQTNPGYYDMLLRPMCMREVGLQLQRTATQYDSVAGSEKEEFLEKAVADFARNIRLIGKNCLSYANAGPMIISAGSEMLRIFERLLLDWVLAPDEHLTPLNALDDDLCVDPHPTDLEATVLLCDGCEGNFNVSRLDPPLLEIPKGDWHCPRCLNGRWWGDLDPRINKYVKLRDCAGASGRITKCFFVHSEGANESPSLMYEVHLDSGGKERAALGEIDEALRKAGTPVPKIRCIEAVAESKGHSAGIDHGLRHDLVPVLLNPKVSDAASQVALSSSVFRDSIATASTLLINDPREMTASEWLRLLALLIMKCSSSDVMQNVASEMEEEAAGRLTKRLEAISKISEIRDVLPNPSDEEESPIDAQSSMDVDVNSAAAGEKETAVEQTTVADKPSHASSGDKDIYSKAVETNAFEVTAMQLDGVPSQPNVAYVEAEAGLSEEDEYKARRSAALAEKNKRQKARDDSISAFCIKNQLRSTVASFEQDNVSQVVESTLATKDPGLAFAATRCRSELCDFCNLADTSLGTNFVRVPDANEWDELISYSVRSRRTNLIADLDAGSDKNDTTAKSRKSKKLVKISLRIGDELVADEKSELYFDKVLDGGMIEFLPKNPDGFQSELQFRYDTGLPFVTGSLKGHECCAISAHNTRKVKVVQNFKEKQSVLAELEEGNRCGRTLEIGRDSAGRSYWSFNSEPESLFVCVGSAKWYKYSEPEAIASVMVSLGKDPVTRDLKRCFPRAFDSLKEGTWTDLLLKRHFKVKAVDTEESTSPAAMDLDSNSEKGEVYDEKESVLVESKVGSHLWDAQVKAVARNMEAKVTGYRVHYEGWSTRFDEWVSEDRVVEASENNRKVQKQMLKDAALSRDGLPSTLDSMEASSYLQAKDRARGDAPLPDFGKIAHVAPSATEDDRIFATMKAALLAIEAALPLGSVNHTENGDWAPEFSNQWRLMVQGAEGPWNLMRCVILLEDIISEEWMKEQIGHLRSCLPSRWKALDEACASSLAMRIFLLDRCIMYGTIDKKRYKPARSKK